MEALHQAVLRLGVWKENEHLVGASEAALSNVYVKTLPDMTAPCRSIWLDERVIASYVAAFSALVLFVQAIRSSQTFRRQSPPQLSDDTRVSSHIKNHGGWTIYTYKLLRFLSTTALFGLILTTTLFPRSPAGGNSLWIPLTATAGYASFLSGLYILLPAPASREMTFHPTLVILAVLGAYTYRDLWPLLTFTLRPLDLAEGPFLWAKAALATFAGFILPILEPYPYIPLDPNDPQEEANLEQTTSLLNFAIFTFLDPTIAEASRVPHLPAERFPPLCDYDRSVNLIERSFKHLDPFAGAKRNVSLFWGICRIFRRSLTIQTFMVFVDGVCKIATPIGTNRLLRYLETGGSDALVKPWVWLLLLAFGPLFRTITFQIYIFYSTGSLVRTESIITSLVFAHALRIRLKAEMPDAPPVPAPPPPAVQVAAPVDGDDDGVVAQAAGEAGQALLPDGGASSPAASEGAAPSVHARSETAVSTLSTASTAVGSASTTNGKADTKKSKKEAAEKKKKDEKKGNLTGRINNLVTSDLRSIVSGRDFLFVAVNAPVNLILSVGFLYTVLGWSSFVGMAAMLALVPVPAWVTKLSKTAQEKRMAAMDARVKTTTDAMNVLRMIKLFGWETQVEGEIDKNRAEELRLLWYRAILGLLNGIVNFIIPLVHIVLTFTIFTLVMKEDLTASIVFSSMVGFNMLRNQLFMMFGFLPGLISANVSLNRVKDFLNDTELLDKFDRELEGSPVIQDASNEHADQIGFGSAMFAWSKEATDGSLTPSRQGFRLRIEEPLVFKQSAFNLVIGPTGSGKTSLLMALLGEMHYIPSGPGSWFNLPRGGGIAYAAQESWVLNETIKENILFGSAFDEARYNKVIYQCGLQRDLSLFEAGDATEIGEKGLTLSGGQKARITLARAVYSSAKILLLDDILAALDVHTSRWLVDKCFKGDLLRDRTVILVTHNVAMASAIAQYIVAMGTDGRIASCGAPSDVIAQDAQLAAKVEHEQAAIATDEAADAATDSEITPTKVVDAPQGGKLTLAEEIQEGHVSWQAFKLYIRNMGGAWPILFWVSYISFSSFSKLIENAETWWLGWWAQQYQIKENVEASFYLTMYALIAGSGIFFLVAYNYLFMGAQVRASRKIHQSLVLSLLTSTFRWLDTTPTSRIIARCTQDIQAIDSDFPGEFGFFIQLSLQLIAKLAAVLIYTPVFLFPGILIFLVGGWLGQIYMKAQLSVKREQSNAKAPVVGVFGGAIAGLPSIRAYNAQEMYTKELMIRVDRYVRASRTFYNLNRWITVRVDFLSGAFTAALATYLLYGPVRPTPSEVGFSLSMAVGFSGMILWWVRLFNDMEVEGNSLERVLSYINIEHEPKPTEGGAPPAYWPASGDLRVEKLSARYSTDGPEVLHDVSFHIKAGERVGVVGRTGSGKSSLTLSLLRCIYTEGAMYYDGIPTHSLNLDSLRSNITIIPQVPELMSGTLRKNLDMFGQHDDATLNNALRAAGLFALQADNEENRITLDSAISAGGSNLSVGQRQILALARAIVRQSKLLILDEATSAIDYETDTIIQTSLRQELKDDVTVITVAHRLQTIMDSDKIMVLDAGSLVEFASPAELLKNDKSFFRALVDESADKEALYEVVKDK